VEKFGERFPDRSIISVVFIVVSASNPPGCNCNNFRSSLLEESDDDDKRNPIYDELYIEDPMS
jgi:hypothetical protein